MFKYVTFVCFLFALEVSRAQDLTASLKMPEMVAPGEDFVVEITIIKGAINSYIKFSQKLPPKFKATKIETVGGDFSFKDSIIQIVWYFPPATNEFTFSYKVSVPKDASGIKKMGGKIYYFFNTDREVFSFEKTHLFVGTPQAYAASTKIVKVADTIPSKSLIEKDTPLIATNTVVITTTDTIITNSTSTTITNKTETPKDTTDLSKTISQAATIKDTFLTKSLPPKNEAQTEIVKEKLSYCVQLGTFKEQVPLETASKFLKNSARGIKNFKDNSGSTTFTVGNFKTHDEAINLKNEMLGKGFTGAFIVSFPDNTTTNSLSTIKSAETKTEIVKTDISNHQVLVNSTKTNRTVETKTLSKEKKLDSKTPTNTVPSSGIKTYSVQIGAFKEEVPLETANNFLKIAAKGVKNLKDNRGFTVYTIGNFSTRDEAVNYKNEIHGKGFPDAFIVTFENGEIVR